MIEQLWFGWSEVGLEGSNLQQIIAASPGLSDPRSPLTQKALKFCYSPTQPTTGWCQADGIRVIFRRTPLGLDGRGRPGMYFVHVLAGDDLRPAQIDPILNSQVLLCQAPETAGTALAQVPLPDPASLGTLSPPDAGIEVVGHYLANLAAGRLTALRATPEQAVPLASFVARLMPESLGLVGFSESETASESAQYDITLAPAPSPLFAEVDPASSAPAGWRDAAQLLLEAGAGNQDAKDCLGVLAGSATSRRDFSISLGHWCAIERGTPDAVTAEALNWLDREPALRRRALRSAALSSIVELAGQGDPAAAQVLEHDLASDGSPVLDAVCVAANGRLAAILNRLVNAGAAVLARTVVNRVAPGEIDLTSLHPFQQQAILGLFSADNQLLPAIERMLESRSLAVSIVGNPRTPVAWQVYAIRRHAAGVPTEAICRFLVQWPELAGRLCARPIPSAVLDRVGDALAQLDVALALQIRDSVAEQIPVQVDRMWWIACFQRLDPGRQLMLLGRSGRSPRYLPPNAIADTCAAAIRWCVANGYPVPGIELLLRVLHIRGHSDSSRDLQQACLAIEQANRRHSTPGPIIDRVYRVVNPIHRGAMVELLVWRLLETTEPAYFQWSMSSVTKLEPVDDTAPRLLRAAEVLVPRYPKAAMHLFSWTVEVLNDETLPDVSKIMRPARVRELLESSGYHETANRQRDRALSKDARRWLNEVLPRQRKGLFGSW